MDDSPDDNATTQAMGNDTDDNNAAADVDTATKMTRTTIQKRGTGGHGTTR